MRAIIVDVLDRFKRYPLAQIEYDDASVTYFPQDEDGIGVRLTFAGQPERERYTVWYNGCHEELEHAGAAIMAFAVGLSTSCRLREYWIAGHPFRWVVDLWSPQRQRWEADWDVVHWSDALRLIWERPSKRYLRNRLIDLDRGNLACAA